MREQSDGLCYNHKGITKRMCISSYIYGIWAIYRSGGKLKSPLINYSSIKLVGPNLGKKINCSKMEKVHKN